MLMKEWTCLLTNLPMFDPPLGPYNSTNPCVCQNLQLMELRTDCLATATYMPVDVHPFAEEDAQGVRYLH